ncbi:MAG: hypothetical protein LBI82_04695 [Dysgonamonadaceae bacterium]|jgi:hypothetical protein|nr:hypothetical protein [Dysgonamonadaceae bacterium]
MVKNIPPHKNSLNFLYLEKEEINKSIANIYEKGLEKRVKIFNPNFEVIRKQILEKMGMVLYQFIIKYLKEEKKNINNFKFYFWPGYITLTNKRVFIWGAETDMENPQQRYYTGIGWDSNGEEFRDCPTTLSYDQVLNSNTFNKCKYFPGSTHYFRLNQKNENGRHYLRLRIPYKNGRVSENGNIFKALHVSTNSNSTHEDSRHTFHIRIKEQNLHKSGQEVKKILDGFINKHNKCIDKAQYRWRWPFNVFPIEEELKEKNFSNRELRNYCKNYQRKIIDIQTHLYTYWIAETLSDGSIFRDEANKRRFKSKLHKLLKDKDLLDLEDKFDFFDKIEKEKQRLKNDPKSKYRDIFFSNWYTLYHEGFSVKEDLGSTMLLTSHELPSDLLFYIAVWIEDIYNNLKLLESKTIAENDIKGKTQKETHQKDFEYLEHTQKRYYNFFIKYLEKIDQKELISIISYLQCGLKVAKNFNNISNIIDKSESEQIDIQKSIENTANMIQDICTVDDFLKRSFMIVSEINRNNISNLARNKNLIIIQKHEDCLESIVYNKELFEHLFHEIFVNAIKHSRFENIDIRVFIAKDEIRVTNTCNILQKDFKEKCKKPDGLGLKIIDCIAEALDFKISKQIEDNIFKTTIQINPKII